MLEIRLEKASSKYLNQIESYRKEMLKSNSSFDGCSNLDKYDNINEWLAYCHKMENIETKQIGLVNADQLLLINGSKEVIGMANVRRKLNESLMLVGGHIGYSICPKYRNKGYGKKMLSLVLEYCKSIKITKVRISCYRDNIASKKIILANNGKYDSTIKIGDKEIERYWITMEEKVKVIIDCDTGSDDAIAVMMAILSEKIDLVGICTVAGNKALNFTTENTLAVVEALNSDVKVYAGCKESMVTKLLPSRRGKYTGFTGVKDEGGIEPKITYHHDHLPLPTPTIKAEKQNAVCWLVETLLEAKEKITMVITGPMTNLAMALRIEPKIADNIKEIVFMGGGFKVFNATRCAEFNIWADPEAAQIVLTSGIKCTMVPLDATHKANFDYADCKRLRAMNNMVTDAVAKMIEQRIEAYDAYQPQAVLGSAPIHDALALGYILEPKVLENINLMRVDVDFSGGMADGQTICDTRAYPDDKRNCYVALDANNDLFHQLVFSLLERVK